jgi:hypothetical protein
MSIVVIDSFVFSRTRTGAVELSGKSLSLIMRKSVSAFPHSVVQELTFLVV